MKKSNNKYKQNTIKFMIIVFFCELIISTIIFNTYGNSIANNTELLIDQKLDKIIYQFFSDLITNDIIKKENIKDILLITKNNNDEILMVNYDLEKSYKILTNISKVLKEGINDLEKGKVNLQFDDEYVSGGKNGLVLNIPMFINSRNIFINNIGPKIPVLVNFNETLLTNLKTKVTNYGFNNALLEIYVTVELQKLIITPIKKYDDKFYYEILISALVINGSVPKFYGKNYESASSILDIPI